MDESELEVIFSDDEHSFWKQVYERIKHLIPKTMFKFLKKRFKNPWKMNIRSFPGERKTYDLFRKEGKHNKSMILTIGEKKGKETGFIIVENFEFMTKYTYDRRFRHVLQRLKKNKE